MNDDAVDERPQDTDYLSAATRIGIERLLERFDLAAIDVGQMRVQVDHVVGRGCGLRSEEHTSELPSLMRISYAVFCLTQNNQNLQDHDTILVQNSIPHNTMLFTQHIL